MSSKIVLNLPKELEENMSMKKRKQQKKKIWIRE